MVSECDFCLRVDPSFVSNEWYDFAQIDKTANFRVIAALGPIAPGHILIVTEAHYFSMAEVTAEELKELERLVKKWRNLLYQNFEGEVVLFEHGTSRSEGQSSACIAHAHLQLVPITLGVDAPSGLVAAPSDFRLPSLSGAGYRLLEVAGTTYVSVDPKNDVSQYWRKFFLNVVGRPDESDYLVFPKHELIALTLERLQSVSEEAGSVDGNTRTGRL